MIDLKMVVLSLVLFYNDREVIQRLRLVEGVHIPVEDGLRLEPGDLVFDELIVSTFEEGIQQIELDHDRKVIQQIKDILDNSVRNLYGKDEEVTTWADGLGGLMKVQQELCGIPIGRDSWFQEKCRELFYKQGYHVPALGERTLEVPPDSATMYDSYALEAHRVMRDRLAHGELTLDSDDTVPNWALTEYDFDLKLVPWWWKRYVSLGKFREGVWQNKLSKKVTEGGKEVYNLKQSEKGRGVIWRPDLRVGALVYTDLGNPTWRETPYSQIVEFGPWRVMEDKPVVKEFIHRFYNEPETLMRRKVGYGPKERWAYGMLTPMGRVLWAPVTYSASKKIDWYEVNDGKPYTPKKRRCLYVGPWVIPYWRVDDGVIEAEAWKDGTYGFGMWKREKYTPMEWGQKKRELLKKGAKDAYLGWPEILFQAPPKEEQPPKEL